MDTDGPLWKLIKACRLRDVPIEVTGGALRSADNDFGLATKEEVLRFIADGGCAQAIPKEVRPLEYGNVHPRPDVYSYRFRSSDLRGYIAFYMMNGCWKIKSFKRDTDPELAIRPLRR